MPIDRIINQCTTVIRNLVVKYIIHKPVRYSSIV